MRDSKSRGAAHPRVAVPALPRSPGPTAAAAAAGPTLPPSLALEAATAAADQALPQHRCGGPCHPTPMHVQPPPV